MGEAGVEAGVGGVGGRPPLSLRTRSRFIRTSRPRTCPRVCRARTGRTATPGVPPPSSPTTTTGSRVRQAARRMWLPSMGGWGEGWGEGWGGRRLRFAGGRAHGALPRGHEGSLIQEAQPRQVCKCASRKQPRRRLWRGCRRGGARAAAAAAYAAASGLGQGRSAGDEPGAHASEGPCTARRRQGHHRRGGIRRGGRDGTRAVRTLGTKAHLHICM